MLMLTTFEVDEYVYEALRAGASGFLLKRTPAADLVAGIRVVAGGRCAPGAVRHPPPHRPVRTPPGRQADRRSARSQEITEREREVLALVAHGLSNAEIAELLVLSEGTVKTHIKHIFVKLDLRDRTQAVIFAYDIGLVEPKGS